jgi:uncharacterized protein YaiI (UPF0178 family)/RimJ/RimL family protein N-acetyltransferase
MDVAAHLARIATERRGLPVRRTARLMLRPWREEDRQPFAAMSADPEVMEHVGAPLSREESDALLDRLRARAAADGLGIWAVEDRQDKAFVGMVGLWVPDWEAPFLPGVELVGRLVRARWGQGLATEAARDALAWAFDGLRLPRVHAWTAPISRTSRRVMERIGMTEAGAFRHPGFAHDDPLGERVRYAADNPRLAAAEPAPREEVPPAGSAAAPPAAAPTKPADPLPASPARELPHVWIDGDGCPRAAKEITWKAAQRGAVRLTMVANRDLYAPRSPHIRAVRVGQGLDVADDWLVANAAPGDLVITSDVPLAAALVPRGVAVMTPRGERFTPANIGEKLSLRDYFTEARESGLLEGGGPAPYDERAKRAFANGLDRWIATRR